MYEIRPFNRKGFIVAAFFVLTIGSVQLAHSQASENAIIDRHISREANRDNCDEYKEARKTLRGDVNGDGKADVVVLYTIEGCGGGLNWARVLAVFVRKGKSIQFAGRVVAGAKGIRAVEMKSISGGRITLDTMSYRRNDGACCPSRKGETKYVFSNGKLREVK
ncbi:MAG: hypothetical protein H7Z38_01065 [Rubrivivax sp.]|nr:hypothetical protein [Pyrinomonadaceae bacterium]